MSFLAEKPEFFWELPQLSDRWHRLHVGRITSSGMDEIITPTGNLSSSKAAEASAVNLVMEHRSGYGDKNLFKGNYWTERGLRLEPDARDSYEFIKGLAVTPCGFISRGIYGCSPDGVAMELSPPRDIEIKCLSQRVHGWVEDHGPEPKHNVQMHSRMVIADFVECHYWGHHPSHPTNDLLIKRDDFTERVQSAMLEFEELVMTVAARKGVKLFTNL